MGSPRTDLVSTLPTESLKTALEFVRGQHVSARDMAIAAENIFSYAANEFLPDDDPMPMFATRGAIHAPMQAAPQADIEAAFARVMSAPPPKKPKARATVPEGAHAPEAQPEQTQAQADMAAQTRLDWKSIIQTLLPFVLGLL